MASQPQLPTSPLGLRPNPARHFVGFFGVREIALGALADIGDTVMLVRELLRARKVERGPLILLGTGLTGSAASVAVWIEANRDQGRVLSAS